MCGWKAGFGKGQAKKMDGQWVNWSAIRNADERVEPEKPEDDGESIAEEEAPQCQGNVERWICLG